MALRTLPILAYACLIHVLTLIPTHAQPYRPAKTSFGSSVFIENQAMYILGGHDSTVRQMFLIDLSTSWDTSSPIYRRLPDGYGFTRDASTLLADQKSWFFMSNQTGYICNLQTMIWRNVSSDTTYTTMKGLGAASDPRTGKVYVPGGDRTSMWAYDPMTGLTYSESKQPYLQDLAYYSVAWASALKSVLVFGGNTGAGISPKNDLYAYSPENGWTVLQPLGTIPPERVVTCLVPAYGGTKMVLFGGFGKDPVRADTLGPGLNDLYILDVNSMTWTRGSDAPSAEARGGHSCAVSGDYLIVWGGASNTLSRVSDVVVYNMKTSSWTSSYVALPNHAPPPYVGVPTSGNGSSQDSSSNGFSTIAIAGTAVGVLAVVIVIGWVLYIYFQGTSSKAPIISDENDSSTPMKPLAQATQTTQPPQPQYEVVVEVSAPPPCYIPHAELRQSLPPRPPPCYIPHPQPARCSIPSRPPQPIRPTQLFKTQQHIFNSWQQQQQTFVAPQDQGFFNSQMDLTGQFQDPLGGSFGDFGGSFDDFGGSFGDLGDAFGILGSFDLGSF